MRLVADGLSWAELAQGDALAIIGATSATINKGWVEPMHVEVIIVDEEAFTDSRVSIIQRVHIKPSVR